MNCAVLTWPMQNGAGHFRPRGFGEQRPAKGIPERHHTAIDIGGLRYGDVVVATEPGVVGSTQGWATGTKALLLHTDTDRTILYGSLQPGSMPAKGTRLARGERLGLLAHYPGPKKKVMLHLEVMEGHRSRNTSWTWGAPQPTHITNPAGYLAAARLTDVFCGTGNEPPPFGPPVLPSPPVVLPPVVLPPVPIPAGLPPLELPPAGPLWIPPVVEYTAPREDTVLGVLVVAALIAGLTYTMARSTR